MPAMPSRPEERIHTFSTRVRDDAGREYEAEAYGIQRPDGTWAGWLAFRDVKTRAMTGRTGQETSQPDRKALEYWAGGLERVYLEGAFRRARERSTAPRLETGA